MMQVFFSSLNVLSIFLKRASGAHLDRIGSNWRLRAPDTLGEFQINFKNREHLELIWSSSGSDWIGSDPIGGCELQILSKIFNKFQKTEGIWSSSGAHTMRCVHFLNLQRISLFPVSCHFKERKEEIGERKQANFGPKHF